MIELKELPKKISLSELTNCTFNAAASLGKMSRTGSELKKSWRRANRHTGKSEGRGS